MPGPIKISVALEMPSPSAPVPEAPPAPTPIEDQVREALDCIESGEDSGREWAFINRTYKALTEMKKPSPRAKNLIEMIKPVLAHYGYHEVNSGEVS